MAMKNDDVRATERSETRIGAAIERPGRPDMRCLISNISQDGAELKLEADQRVPQHFVLHVPKLETAYRAEVRWRENGCVGLAFTASEPRPRPVLKAV